MNSSIIIADDHPIILKGLNDFLVENGYQVKGKAINGKEAIDLIRNHKPDIAILDIQMPYLTGIEVVELCRKEGLSSKIIIITLEKDIELYQKCKELDIYGYVLKEFALEELQNCIEAVEGGKPYFSPELISYLRTKEKPQHFDVLTSTEIEVLKHIALNKTAKEIGESMFISNRTVEKHKSNIIKKLNLEPIQNSLLIWVKENQEYIL